MLFQFSYDRLFASAWLLFWAYWILMSLQVRRSRKSESGLLRFVHVAFLGFIFALIALPQFGRGILGQQLLGGGGKRCFAGALLLVLGIGLAVWARFHLGSYWSGTITLKEGHRVIRTGPYRLVRHPIYVGLWVA